MLELAMDSFNLWDFTYFFLSSLLAIYLAYK